MTGWGLIASFWIGNVILLVLNLPFIGVFVRILKIPYDALYIAMLFFICVGVFSIRNSVFDIFIVLGFILGPMIEENLRRALLLSRGSFNVFISTPVSATFMALCVITLVATAGLPLVRRSIRKAASDVAVENEG